MRRSDVVLAALLLAGLGGGCAEPAKRVRREEPVTDGIDEGPAPARPPSRPPAGRETHRVLTVATDPARAAIVVTERDEDEPCELPLRAVEAGGEATELDQAEAELPRELPRALDAAGLGGTSPDEPLSPCGSRGGAPRRTRPVGRAA